MPLWIMPALPVFFVGLWCGACLLLSFLSGWRRLAAHYATEKPISGRRFRFRSARARLVRYNGVLNLAVAREGLHLWLLLPFRLGSRRLLVPWRDISAMSTREWMIERVTLSFARAPGVTLRIGAALAAELAAASNGAFRIAT